MNAEKEAMRLQRIGSIEFAYTIVLIVGMFACVALIPAIGAWVLLIAVALFAPKIWLHERWFRQLERVAEASPAARRFAQQRGYLPR